MPDFMRGDAHVVAINPHTFPAAPAARRPRAAFQPHHHAVVFIVIKTQLANLRASVTVLQPEAVNRPAVRRIFLNIPRLAVRERHSRSHRRRERQLAIRSLRVMVADIAHHIIERGFRGRRVVLILKSHRDHEHLDIANRRRRHRRQNPRKSHRPARRTFAVNQRLLINRRMAPIAQINDFAISLQRRSRLRDDLALILIGHRVLSRNRTNSHCGQRQIRLLAHFQNPRWLLVHSEIIFNCHTIHRGIRHPQNRLRATPINMRLISLPRFQFRDAVSRCRRRIIHPHALINPNRPAPIHPFLKLRNHLRWQLLPHHHRHRLTQSLLRIRLDQLAENRPPFPRQFHTFRDQSPPFLHRGGDIPLCPRSEFHCWFKCCGLLTGADQWFVEGRLRFRLCAFSRWLCDIWRDSLW